MSFELIPENQKINFPVPINIRNTEKLIDYISEKLPGRINYQVNHHLKSSSYNPEEKKLEKEIGVLEITGNIISFKNMGIMDTLALYSNKENPTYLSSLVFMDFSGNSKKDENIRNLWNDVRRIIDDYFIEKLNLK